MNLLFSVLLLILLSKTDSPYGTLFLQLLNISHKWLDSYKEFDKTIKYWSTPTNGTPDIIPNSVAASFTETRGMDFKAYHAHSEKRAESVTEYLITKGIDKNRLKSYGFGDSLPILPNTSEENRAQNRRVEIKVLSD